MRCSLLVLALVASVALLATGVQAQAQAAAVPSAANNFAGAAGVVQANPCVVQCRAANQQCQSATCTGANAVPTCWEGCTTAFQTCKAACGRPAGQKFVGKDGKVQTAKAPKAARVGAALQQNKAKRSRKQRSKRGAQGSSTGAAGPRTKGRKSSAYRRGQKGQLKDANKRHHAKNGKFQKESIKNKKGKLFDRRSGRLLKGKKGGKGKKRSGRGSSSGAGPNFGGASATGAAAPRA